MNISKYVNATTVTADSWIFLWTWTEVPQLNGVNTIEKYVYANITFNSSVVNATVVSVGIVIPFRTPLPEIAANSEVHHRHHKERHPREHDEGNPLAHSLPFPVDIAPKVGG